MGNEITLWLVTIVACSAVPCNTSEKILIACFALRKQRFTKTDMVYLAIMEGVGFIFG